MGSGLDGGSKARHRFGTMLPEWLEKILILQDRDAKKTRIETQIRHIPKEVSACEEKITQLETNLELARKTVQDLELKRKGLESEIAADEDHLGRYKNQQLQVKKNDEYKALTHEIEGMEAKILDLEEAEIQVLLDLDVEKANLSKKQEEIKGEVAYQQNLIKKLGEREINLKKDLEEAEAEVDKARSESSEKYLKPYDRLAKTLKPPVVVPLRDQKCGGCHLKVSSGVDSEVRAKDENITCDNCRRLLYWEA
jgi:predicted  nucleic acid-binding Zn-ribbon protein